MLATQLGRILLERVGWRYLLGPFFKASTPDAAAPLSATYREAGAVGTLTVTDASNVLSLAGGEVVWSGTPAAGTGLVSPALARVAGRVFICRVTRRVAGTLRFGWHATATADGNITYGFRTTPGTTAQIGLAAGVVIALTGLASGDHDYATVLRLSGAFLLYRSGDGQPWTLVWVASDDSTANLYARQTHPGTVVVDHKAKSSRVADLGGAFASDYGLATDRKATSAAADTIAHAADCLVEHTITAATAVTQELWVRRTDASNGWIVRMDQAGSTIKLIELVAGVETERASTAQTWTNGTQYRVVVICAGTTITPYVANVAKTGYASASTNQTATQAYVSHAGVDLVAWPRTVTLPQGV